MLSLHGDRPRGYDPATWVSAVDMVGLMSDIWVLTAELIVIFITLWLLFRMTTLGEKYDPPVEAQQEADVPLEAVAN